MIIIWLRGSLHFKILPELARCRHLIPGVSDIMNLLGVCNELDKLVTAHMKLIDANSTAVGNLRRDMKK